MKQYIKLLSLAVLVAFSTSLFSQKKTFFDANWKKTKEKNAKYYRIVTPNGSEFQVEDYFKESDKLQMKGTYNNKKLENKSRTGLFTYYYENGQKSYEGEYKNGEEEGKWTYWFKNGNVKSEGNYEGGETQGEWKYYHKNAAKKTIINYVDGSKDGNVIHYYDNGEIEEEYNYLKGKKNGAFKEYFKGNILKESGTFEKDSLVGEYNYFWKNKNQSSKGNYKDNKKDGVWTWFHSNGKTSCIAEYKKGKFIKADFYDETGEKMSKKVYEDDLFKSREFPGGPQGMLEIINKQIGKRVDFDKAKKEKYIFTCWISLKVDEEGNVIEREWIVPDTDEEDFEDEWGLVRNMNSAIDVFPRFTPQKSYNRNVEVTFFYMYTIDFGKVGTTSLSTF